MTTTDARKRHLENKAAERLCRVLHHLEWREDGTGRTAPCGGCRQHSEKLTASADDAGTAIGRNPNGCLDIEDYARIHNEGYDTAMRHARALLLELPTRIVTIEPAAPDTGEPLLSEHVVRRGDILTAFPARADQANEEDA
jgi:hypothetical protein